MAHGKGEAGELAGCPGTFLVDVDTSKYSCAQGWAHGRGGRGWNVTRLNCAKIIRLTCLCYRRLGEGARSVIVGPESEDPGLLSRTQSQRGPRPGIVGSERGPMLVIGGSQSVARYVIVHSERVPGLLSVARKARPGLLSVAQRERPGLLSWAQRALKPVIRGSQSA